MSLDLSRVQRVSPSAEIAAGQTVPVAFAHLREGA